MTYKVGDIAIIKAFAHPNVKKPIVVEIIEIDPFSIGYSVIEREGNRQYVYTVTDDDLIPITPKPFKERPDL